MRVLSLTTLYPHAGAPHHGVFVENRLAALAARGHEVRVVAPVPWFPSSAPIFGAYAAHAGAPASERRRGIAVSHPRYVLPPRTAMGYAPSALTRCLLRAAREAIAEGFAPELIDAHYLYPDGVAAAEVARALDLPLVLTARGTDVSLLPRFPRQRRAILAAVAQAETVITVADALRDELIALGADPHRVVTLRNGVDLEAFTPGDRAAARARLGVPAGVPLLASVGHLTERKGHHLVIDALAEIEDAHLVVAGTGEARAALGRQAEAAGLSDRVRLLGAVPHAELAEVYRAADALVLASSREGWPNVLLEAMACGTPCVATPVWGSGEVVSTPAAGMLAAERTVPALAEAVRALLAAPPPRAATRAHAERHGWGPVAEGVERVWRDAARRRAWGAAWPAEEGRKPGLLLTVDTEECFDWTGEEAGWHVAPPDGIERLQALAERHGLRPLYFASCPIIEDEAAGAALARLVSEGRADVGLHLHSWSTPPTAPGTQGPGAPTGPQSFQCNLDPELHRRKLAHLIEAFRARFGREPAAHRAGRYGVAPWVLDQLAEAGVMADFSPSAAFDFTAKGGPDFSRLAPHATRRDTPRGEQRVYPVSGARHWRRVKLFGAPPTGLTGAGPLASAGLARAARLSPEGMSSEDMQRLARHLAGEGVRLLTPTIHSSSVEAGATEYAGDEAEARTLLGRLDAFLGWATGQGWRPVTLAELTASSEAQGASEAQEAAET